MGAGSPPREGRRGWAEAPAVPPPRGCDRRSRRAAPEPRQGSRRDGSGVGGKRAVLPEGRGAAPASPTPRRPEASPGRAGSSGAHAPRAGAGAGLRPPAASRGACSASSAPPARPFPKPRSLRPGRKPREPRAAESLGPRRTRDQPQEKVRGNDSPVGAAVAAAVPEVPEGAPKLKAMSREQGTEKQLPRHSVHSASRSGGETSSGSRSSASFRS